MKKLKLSPWHDGSVKPVYVGKYDVMCACCRNIFRPKWNGVKFIGVRGLVPKKWRGVLK